jgi:carbonic anhydrase/acetyltransferase-like protein (isoleucine patch superfamily)
MPIYEIDGKRPVLAEDGSTWIAPSADVIGEAILGRDVSVWFGAVIRADNTPIVVGDGTNIQEGAMLHSDPGIPLTVGRNCTIGHHAILHGCTIGDNVLVGMAATILNGAKIGDDCLVGAGALVTENKEFPPGSLIVGVPATVKRPLDEAAIATMRVNAEHYVEKRRVYAVGLKRVG